MLLNFLKTGSFNKAQRTMLEMEEKQAKELRQMVLDAMDVAIENRDAAAGVQGESTENADIRSSIKVDDNGKKYVVIDEDIIKGISGAKNIKKVVKEYIKNTYPSIDMLGFTLGTNAQSRNEFTNSRYTQYLQCNLKELFIDKMRMASNLDEIVNVGEGYTWEDIKHSRKDNLIGFVRGNVQIKVGNNSYLADIVLANDKTKGLIFYDIVNLKNIKIKEATTERTHDNHAAQKVVASKNILSAEKQNASRNSIKVDSDGRKLSDRQSEYFADTKVVDGDGNLLVVYHGSPNKFTVFDAERIGTLASAEGYGFYFTDSQEKAEGYREEDGNVMKGYLDIKKPLSLDEVTITKSEVKKLLEILDPTGDDILSNYDASGFGYPSRAWYNNAMRDTLEAVMENENDADIIAEIINAYGSMAALSEVRKNLGYDGYMAPDKYANGKVYVAFESNQFKNIDNENPTDNEDVRYSIKVEDSEGRKLTDAQQEFFADSKVVDDQGRLLVLYHGTPMKGFTVFKANSYFSDNKNYSELYTSKSASAISSPKTQAAKNAANTPGVYEVYLNMTKPFDTRLPENEKIFNEIRMEYGLSQLQESGLPDWTDGNDIFDYIEENELDFDGLILDEGGYFDSNGDVVNRGLSYIIFDSNQVKNVDNLNPTADEDIRKSIKVDDARNSFKTYGEASPYTDSLEEVHVITTMLSSTNSALFLFEHAVADIFKLGYYKHYDKNCFNFKR